MLDTQFDPNDISISNGCYYALPYSIEQSALVLVSVPWDVTVSYGKGTAGGPDAIIEASEQLDLYDHHCGNTYEKGIATMPIDEEILEESAELRRDAERIIACLAEGEQPRGDIKRRLDKINDASTRLNEKIFRMTSDLMTSGKKVGLVGGDHSTPLGYMRAVGKHHGEFGILHIDAHADLREAYEGFKYSHASIMFNALREVENLKSITQVGIRDYCEAEREIIDTDSRVTTFFDADMAADKFTGVCWSDICDRIIDTLPQKVYVSFDIDGLSPDNCPSTGTPVPGGLSFNEAVFLLKKLSDSGKEIIGFDLTEVAPNPTDSENHTDANIGARVLYKLCNFSLKD